MGAEQEDMKMMKVWSINKFKVYCSEDSSWSDGMKFIGIEIPDSCSSCLQQYYGSEKVYCYDAQNCGC
jgi:hypothetical protein